MAVIQRNAIKSWTLLRPACEIILLGDDAGTAECAAEFGLRHVPEVARNEYGTPLLNDIFEKAERSATNNLLCYVNADIILMSDFMRVIEHFSRCDQRFLLIGQRWDLNLLRPWDFEAPDWETRLLKYMLKHGRPHHIGGMDYFVFRPGFFGTIPPFAIGRCIWDNWLVYQGRNSGAAVVNITKAAVVVHQNHDYAHISYSPSLQGRPGIDRGPERLRNTQLAGWPLPYFDLRHATHIMSVQRIREQTGHSTQPLTAESGTPPPCTA